MHFATVDQRDAFTRPGLWVLHEVACGAEVRAQNATSALEHVTCMGCLAWLAAQGLRAEPLGGPSTVREAAVSLRVSERLLRRLLAEGRLGPAAFKIGGVWRIDVEGVRALLARPRPSPPRPTPSRADARRRRLLED